MDLDLPDVEYFLFLRNPWRLRLPDAEYSGKIIFVPVFVHVLEHEVHLCIVNEYLVQMQAFLIEQTVKGESCNYVFGTEECIYFYRKGIIWVRYRMTVGYHGVLEDKSGERLEMYLFEGYVAVKSFGQLIHNLFRHIRLNLRELDHQCNRKEKA